MDNGGLKYSRRSEQFIKFTGLMIPLILVFYGILIQTRLLESRHYISDIVLFFIIVAWTLLASFQFLYPNKSHKLDTMCLVSYHALIILYILFVSGFSTLLVSIWLLLFLLTYTQIGLRGLQYSITALIACAVVDMIWRQSVGDYEAVLINLLSLLALMTIGISSIALFRLQEVDKKVLTRAQSQESLQRERTLAIINNLSDGVIVVDNGGIVRIYNAASLNLLDTNDSLNGHHIDEIVPLTTLEKDRIHIFDELKHSTKTVIRDDLEFSYSDNEQIRLELTFSPIRGSFSRTKKDTTDGYILILRDVTKQKSLEEERDEFISVVSHELRTPITIAEGTISNVQMMMGREDIKPHTVSSAIDVAHDQVIFLAKMVNDLSTLSRAERGVADAEEVINVGDTLKALYKNYAPEAEAKKLHFNLNLGTHLGEIKTSRLYFEELLQDFITNSIKYRVGNKILQ